MKELKSTIDKLDEKYFINEEITKEKYDRFAAKLNQELRQIGEELSNCGHTISNLNMKLVQAARLACNLPEMWQLAPLSEKEKLQKLIFPEGLPYDKKIGRFRTSKINSVIADIARQSGDLALTETGLKVVYNSKSRFAVWTGLERFISSFIGYYLRP